MKMLTKMDKKNDEELQLKNLIKELKEDESCQSLMKKHLTLDVVNLKTTHGRTVYDVIKSGVENRDSEIGIYLPDGESYVVFASLVDPILSEYHKIRECLPLEQPSTDFGDLNNLGNLDPDSRFVLSTRCRVARNLSCLPFNSSMRKADYEILEATVKDATSALEEGEYLPLSMMSETFQSELIKNHLLFKSNDKFLRSANALNFWPTGRGIFLNKAETLLIWVGEEDHLRIISMETGANLKNVIWRLKNTLETFSLEFSRSAKYGFLTFCPTNVGTAMRCSVHIKLPKLSNNITLLNCICERFKLQVRGTNGEHSEAEGGVFDISNKRRFGVTEEELLCDVQFGIREIIREEKRLEKINSEYEKAK